MEGPPNSLDMNPIEHVWQALKAALHSQFPDIYAIHSGLERVCRNSRHVQCLLELGESNATYATRIILHGMRRGTQRGCFFLQ